MSSKAGIGSRASDEDARTAVRVGKSTSSLPSCVRALRYDSALLPRP